MLIDPPDTYNTNARINFEDTVLRIVLHIMTFYLMMVAGVSLQFPWSVRYVCIAPGSLVINISIYPWGFLKSLVEK